MAFERPLKGLLVFSCDACSEVAECDESGSTYAECWGELREQGWRAQKPVGYDWEHYCPDCAKLSDKDRVPRAADARIRR